MGIIDAALTAALAGRRTLPRSVREASSASGGNAPLARAMAGLEPTGKLPPKGSDAYKRYRTALRNLERYQAPEGRQQRGTSGRGRLLDQARRTATTLIAGANIGRARQAGLDMRLRASLRVSKVVRTHTMPADAGGKPRFVRIPAAGARPALDAWEAGDLDVAGAELLAAFFAAYWGDMPEVTERDSCQVKVP